MTDDGQLGDRYEVLRTLSSGHGATLLQALDRLHDRMVALKVYPVAGADPEALLAEARVLMGLPPHPSLPVVRGDFFTDDGRRYVIVMNWIDGKNLQEILDDEGTPSLPLLAVLADLTQAAAALDHLHAQDPVVVHGDVKPANLVRAAGGRIVLVDFDVAAGQESRSPAGTLGYMAPEVAAGDKPQPSADVFGLAATAFTLLNGRSPSEGLPTFPGLDYLEQSQVARVLRSAMATDPTRRPMSAGALVEELRAVSRVEQPSGVVAFLALEVADAERLWDEEPEEMRSAMARLRDLRDEVVHGRGGRVVTSMNEGDRSIVAFGDPTAAAIAALDLHDRVAVEAFPPGLEVALCAAIAVGEAALVDGVYIGPVVDQVVRLRSLATAGITVASEATAEQLLELVGQELSIVPFRAATSGRPTGAAVFALTRPGAESVAAPRQSATELTFAPSMAEAPSLSPPGHARGAIAQAALEHPLTLTGVLLAGLAIIFRLILAGELGYESIGAVGLAAGLFLFAGSFGWQYIHGSREARAAVSEAARLLERERQDRTIARERLELRQRLKRGFVSVDSASAIEGTNALRALADEFDAVQAMVGSGSERSMAVIPAVLPHLAEEAYRNGMSALSDALELLESAEGPSRRRLDHDLADIESRMRTTEYTDERSRARDEQRLESHRQLLARHDESRQRGLELIFEAERCTVALSETRLEVASIRAGNTQVDVDAVIDTLQHTIRRVREVQDEFRKLGY